MKLRLARRVLYEARFFFYGISTGTIGTLIDWFVKGDIIDGITLLLWLIIIAWFPHVYGLREDN